MAKSKTAPKKAAPKKAAPKKKVNKSQAIRDAVKDNPKAGPTEIAQIVSKRGIKVTPTFVSTVKTMAKKRKRRAKRKAAPVAKPAVSDKVSLSTLVQAKKLADQMGGVEKAKDALAALAKLQ